MQNMNERSGVPSAGYLAWIIILLVVGTRAFEKAWLLYEAKLVRGKRGAELIQFSLHGIRAYALCVLFLLVIVLLITLSLRMHKIFRYRSLLLGDWQWKHIGEVPLAAGLAFLAASPLLMIDHKSLEVLNLIATSSSRAGAILVAVLFVIVMPFFLEVVFRGILFSSCAALTGAFTASIAIALLYSYIWPFPALLPSFLLGVACSVIYYRSKNVILSFATNAIFTLATSIFIL